MTEKEKKNAYSKPNVEFLKFNYEDVIKTSTPPGPCIDCPHEDSFIGPYKL